MAEYSKNEALDWARENLRGQWTTLMTPFTPDDEFDEEGMRGNIRHIRSLGTQGGGCTWGMGEFWSLTLEERLRVFREGAPRKHRATDDRSRSGLAKRLIRSNV